MKVKDDFVTNSSSSSFIINSGFHKTTKSVAKIMIKRMFKHADELFHRSILEDENEFRERIFENLKSIKERNANILIPFSCNYETYIIKDPEDGQIKVFTCNNHGPWDDYLHIKHSFSEENSLDFKFNNTLFINIETLAFQRGDEYDKT